MKEMPKQINVTITRGLLQGYCVPPHCRASRRQITDGMKIMVPIGSKRLSVSHDVCFAKSREDVTGDLGRKISMTTSAMAPIGKLTTVRVSSHCSPVKQNYG